MRTYLDPRMLGLLVLGFSSGLPRLLVYSTLTFWLVEVGLDIGAVGVFAATATPYNLKFLWAPLLDRLPIPGLTRILGQRRSWIFSLQVGLAASIVVLAMTDPALSALATGMAAVVVAAFSASQDVVIDAYRVDLLDDDEQGAGAAVAVFGYRLGMLVASAGALYIAAFAESWSLTYIAMAGLVAIAAIFTWIIASPPGDQPVAGGSRDLKAHLIEGVVGPFRDFTKRDAWLLILLFVVLYKLGDALAGTMTNPFLIKIGFTKIEIANIAKTYGLVASIFGVFLGGWVVKKMGILPALWMAGLLQLASNFMFSIQAAVGHDSAWLIATIGIENLTGGVGTAAFVAYLSSLCTREYTATQYALLTALSSTLRTFISTGSGFVAETTGWFWYFILTAIAALPGLLMLLLLQKRLVETRDDSN